MLSNFPNKKYNPKKRVVIDSINTQIDCGEYATKATINDVLSITAKIFADGHNELRANLLYKHANEKNWRSIKMNLLGNDSWQAQFNVTKLGIYQYTISAWIDDLLTLQKNILDKQTAKQSIENELLRAINMLQKKESKVSKKYKNEFVKYIHFFKDKHLDFLLENDFAEFISQFPDPETVTQYKVLNVSVDREIAQFSAWYEVFPRSLSDTGKHGTFKDLIKHLNYIADLGFNIVYLPPIHPIGNTNRKGKNNTISATHSDPGSPWAIGSEEGGHKSIHTELGTFSDFAELIQRANDLGMEIALDYALQCSRDHPYLKDHPEWFTINPDGSIQYAENPPKKYEDIYPFNFQTEDWQRLWEECRDIILFWIKAGVKIFRVDNPHTKPFQFWQWMIESVKGEYPEVIFLSEAFTKPATMYHLAKLGFTQSYTYFTWKNSKHELIEYLTEISKPPINLFFRANFWPNTPDILNAYLQNSPESAFLIRLILAATLATNYGIYGPLFELGINQPFREGSEEYLNSEKYEIKKWKYNDNKILKLIKKINHIRQHHKALHNIKTLKFHHIDNDQLLCYSKHDETLNDIILVTVNLDPYYKQSGFLHLSLPRSERDKNEIIVHDLLTDESYQWNREKNYIELDPNKIPAHIFHIKNL